jgi:hypothetical protein
MPRLELRMFDERLPVLAITFPGEISNPADDVAAVLVNEVDFAIHETSLTPSGFRFLQLACEPMLWQALERWRGGLAGGSSLACTARHMKELLRLLRRGLRPPPNRFPT